MKHPLSRQAFLDLAAQSDVVIENFKTGGLDKLGCGYSILSELNSKIILCSVSAYGPKGPYKGVGGYDTTLQAFSGIISTTGFPDQPVKLGIPLLDILTGYIAFGCIGNALYAR